VYLRPLGTSQTDAGKAQETGERNDNLGDAWRAPADQFFASVDVPE
jgi:hypothetical protein